MKVFKNGELVEVLDDTLNQAEFGGGGHEPFIMTRTQHWLGRSKWILPGDDCVRPDVAPHGAGGEGQVEELYDARDER
jgi:hypothetical protein